MSIINRSDQIKDNTPSQGTHYAAEYVILASGLTKTSIEICRVSNSFIPGAEEDEALLKKSEDEKCGLR